MSAVDRLIPPKNLRVLITAGGGGIGRAISHAFLDAGAKVAVTDIAQDALEEAVALRPSLIAHQGDAANGDDIQTAIDDVVQRWGGLDVLVNNAGIAGETGLIEDLDEEEYERCMDVNLSSMFMTARRCAKLLKTSQGSMINISSVAGRFGYGLRTPYAASKWGVIGLTKSLAVEMGPDGVRVNAILPGVVEGPRIDRVINARAKAREITYDQMRDEALSKVSLRRMVTGQDIASMCLFLTSPGGANISGQSLSVCGNVEVL
ncbi:MAG: SDR family oxidoreductase [Alphaproteobacteria bacterium]|jgi:NAD(P)-dependent dehydrogenase (short-subunit alcohol dehydrogenase family)|nr:SDR family oxidoreductase [Alphaproteobacteria bacterium]